MLQTIYKLARKKVNFCHEDQDLSAVANLLQEKNIDSVLINNDDGKMVGIVTVGDILRSVAKKRFPHRIKAKEVMSGPVITINKNTPLDKATHLFKKNKVTRLVLVDAKNKPKAMIRDLEVYKYFTFCKFDEEARSRFAHYREEHKY